jgi:Domain of unknown function (DUF4124)
MKRGPTRPLSLLAALMRLASPLTAPLAITLAIVTATLSVALVNAAEVFRTVDTEGHVVYTDHADPNAPKEAIQVKAMSAKQAARAAKVQATQKAAELQHRKLQAVETAKIAKLDHDAQVQCDEAQKNFYAMKTSERLSHQDSTGNRVYYSDTEAAMKREEARQTIVLACTD